MNLAIVGKGVMGHLTAELAAATPAVENIYRIEPAAKETLFGFPDVDMVIDFSHPDALADIAAYIKERNGKTGVVFATTGFTGEQLEEIRSLAGYAPVIQSYNYSYGIHSLKKLLAAATDLLETRSDIEIIEKHHNLKVDAPSGTALMLAEVCDPVHQRKWLCGRQGEGKRSDEIGIHSIRGGNIFGEHHVIFAMEDELIEISHRAFSKKIFAKGALDAAIWLNGRKKGMYAIEDVFY